MGNKFHLVFFNSVWSVSTSLVLQHMSHSSLYLHLYSQPSFSNHSFYSFYLITCCHIIITLCWTFKDCSWKWYHLICQNLLLLLSSCNCFVWNLLFQEEMVPNVLFLKKYENPSIFIIEWKCWGHWSIAKWEMWVLQLDNKSIFLGSVRIKLKITIWWRATKFGIHIYRTDGKNFNNNPHFAWLNFCTLTCKHWINFFKLAEIDILKLCNQIITKHVFVLYSLFYYIQIDFGSHKMKHFHVIAQIITKLNIIMELYV